MTMTMTMTMTMSSGEDALDHHWILPGLLGYGSSQYVFNCWRTLRGILPLYFTITEMGVDKVLIEFQTFYFSQVCVTPPNITVITVINTVSHSVNNFDTILSSWSVYNINIKGTIWRKSRIIFYIYIIFSCDTNQTTEMYIATHIKAKVENICRVVFIRSKSEYCLALSCPWFGCSLLLLNFA